MRIIFATLPGGHFWSYGPSWTNIDVARVTRYLRDLGHAVHEINITSLSEQALAADDMVIYTSSDNPEVRQYIKDVIYLASLKCGVVPNICALFAHENKGFQQLMRDELGFGNLDGRYGFDVDVLQASMPYVFKLISGAGSSQVELVSKPRDIKRIVSKHFARSVRRRMVDLYRWFSLAPEDWARYQRRKRSYAASVRQQFVPELSCDYKVLAFGDRYYALRRAVRKEDFRASGSGKFSFDTPPDAVLDFAADVHARLASPYCSLDIAVPASDEPVLIEYQCLSFGPYTVVSSPGYYVKRDGVWAFQQERTSLEDAICHAFGTFLSRIEGGNVSSSQRRSQISNDPS